MIAWKKSRVPGKLRNDTCIASTTSQPFLTENNSLLLEHHNLDYEIIVVSRVLIPSKSLQPRHLVMSTPNNTTIRRNGTAKRNSISISSTTSTQTHKDLTMPTRSHPPIQTLLIYPAILLVAGLYAVISPAAHHGSANNRYITPSPPTAPGIASTLNMPEAHEPLSYFARKNNILNLYFVKIGWLWTTAAFLSLVATQHAYTSSPARIPRAVLRYALVTGTWILTTQWCFGPALIDRGFTVTGGKCERVLSAKGDVEAETVGQLATGWACKAAGGKWNGGHDISGHIFMLALGSAFLALEIWGVRGWLGKSVGTVGGKENEGSEVKEEGLVPKQIQNYAVRFVWTVVGLQLWMFMMTGIWFHTWLEKV